MVRLTCVKLALPTRPYASYPGRVRTAIATVVLFLGVIASDASAGDERASYRFRQVLRTLSATHVTAPASEPTKLYVVEQEGRVRVAVDGRLRRAAFLDLRGRILSGGDQGMLSSR